MGAKMLDKRTAIKKLIAILAILTSIAAPAMAQQYRMNLGCPSAGDADFGKYTIEELSKLCFDARPSDEVLNCGQHRFNAQKARIDTSFVEGLASQQIVDKYCDGAGKPDSAVPDQSYSGGNTINGAVRFERGYNTRWTGSKARTCGNQYTGMAYINNGTIEFNSGGHTWRGTISANSYISISRNGVFPRPKNPTSIVGPMFNAELYNGFCGGGYFRLITN